MLTVVSSQSVAPGGSITNTSSAPYQSSYNASVEEEEEPEPIRQWRIKRDADLAERDRRSAEKKAETIKKAQQDIDEFYENYNGKKEKTLSASKRDAEEFLANRQDTSAGGTAWSRIAGLVDTTGRDANSGGAGSNKAKFRELLQGLKKDENAPGASGI